MRFDVFLTTGCGLETLMVGKGGGAFIARLQPTKTFTTDSSKDSPAEVELPEQGAPPADGMRMYHEDTLGTHQPLLLFSAWLNLVAALKSLRTTSNGGV